MADVQQNSTQLPAVHRASARFQRWGTLRHEHDHCATPGGLGGMEWKWTFGGGGRFSVLRGGGGRACSWAVEGQGGWMEWLFVEGGGVGGGGGGGGGLYHPPTLWCC